MSILDYSTTAGSNTAIGGIGIQGSNAVLNFDNALRQFMADLASATTRYATKSANYTGLKSDHNQLIEFTATATFSLTAAATLTNGWSCVVKANGGTVTIDPASSEQIDGATTKTLLDGSFAFVYCDGTAFHTVAVSGTLADVGALTPTDGNFIVGNGTTWVAESGATVQASLGLTIGTDVQAYDADLNAIAGLTSAADKVPYYTGSGTAALSDFSNFGRSLVDDANASAARTTLELGTISTQAANSVAVTGGAIDGASIGATTPAAGTFSTLSASTSIALPATVTVSQNTNFSSGNSVELELNKAASGQLNRVWGQTNGSNRWAMDFGDATAESGSNAGSDWTVKAYDDSGTLIGDAWKLKRDDRQMLLYGEVAFVNDSPIAWNAGPTINVGSGSPEGAVTAPRGSLYLRTDGGTNSTIYAKESGSSNTGWAAL